MLQSSVRDPLKRQEMKRRVGNRVAGASRFEEKGGINGAITIPPFFGSTGNSVVDLTSFDGLVMKASLWQNIDFRTLFDTYNFDTNGSDEGMDKVLQPRLLKKFVRKAMGLLKKQRVEISSNSQVAASSSSLTSVECSNSSDGFSHNSSLDQFGLDTTAPVVVKASSSNCAEEESRNFEDNIISGASSSSGSTDVHNTSGKEIVVPSKEVFVIDDSDGDCDSIKDGDGSGKGGSSRDRGDRANQNGNIMDIDSEMSVMREKRSTTILMTPVVQVPVVSPMCIEIKSIGMGGGYENPSEHEQHLRQLQDEELELQSLLRAKVGKLPTTLGMFHDSCSIPIDDRDLSHHITSHYITFNPLPRLPPGLPHIVIVSCISMAPLHIPSPLILAPLL